MSRPPNVIFIITDDQGYGDIGCHGNPWLMTPNLDRLAGESVQLHNHHHDPLCSPSRAALLTGQYAARNGVWHVIQGRHLLHPDAVTMADCFSANGYRAAMFGKWHLGDNYPFAPRYRGFDETLCHKGGGVGELPDYWGNDYFDDTYFRNGEPLNCAGYCTDVFFGAALDFISDSVDTPFFVYLATNAMHAPFRVEDRYAAPYREQGIPNRRANFYGMIANFDENLGRLLQRLDDLGLAENTIVVFTSDHGTAAGVDPSTGAGYNAGMRGVKGSVYEGGHRVSFFMRWPGQLPAARRISQPTAHIDVLPTLVDLCGIRAANAADLDGISLAPLLRGETEDLPDRAIVIQLQPDQPRKWHHTALIRGRWRLIKGEELYDVERDPGQCRDVAAEYGQIIAALRQDYDSWWREMQDAFTQTVAIPIGSEHENPTLLSARDWHPTSGRVPWMQERIDDPAYDAEGYWLVDVLDAGVYKIELRAHPREADLPMGTVAASLAIGDTEYRRPCRDTDAMTVFDVELNAGVTSLSTLLVDAAGIRRRGACYVYASKV
ncbi:MAG: arylsulfatase [Chloroflexi bacterium]|nr:arylsulfatase [Chloroflexota bacterium]